MNFVRLKNWLAARRDRRLRALIWREATAIAQIKGGNIYAAVEQVAEAHRHLQTLDLKPPHSPRGEE